MSDLQERIREFLAAGPYGVAGASAARSKYGNKVLRCYQQDGRAPLYPLNPRGGEIEGLRAYRTLAEVPETIRSLSIITPPAITEELVDEAARHGVSHLWLQPGAESAPALRLARERGLACIPGGPCLLVVLGFRERG